MIELFAPQEEECVQQSSQAGRIPVRQKGIRSTDSSWDSIIFWI